MSSERHKAREISTGNFTWFTSSSESKTPLRGIGASSRDAVLVHLSQKAFRSFQQWKEVVGRW